MHLFSFSGKADRFEWWTVSLLSDLAAQLCLIFGFLTLYSDHSLRYLAASALWLGAVILFWLALAVSVRRMRDRERSPWLLFAALIPIMGWAWYLIECGFLPAPRSGGPKVLVKYTVTAPKSSEQPDV